MMHDALTNAFRTAIAGRDSDVDLFAGAMVIAGLGRQRIEQGQYTRMLDTFAGDVLLRADGATSVPELTDAISHELFYAQGFHGNTTSYGEVENSYLDRVLERHTGIPITLSLVYMEVARRVGLRCDGVGYPGHFLVRCGEPEEAVYVDPFHGGSRLDREELLAGLRSRNLNGATPESFLAAVTRRQLLQRMLNNLRAVYCEAADMERWLGAVELALCIEPWSKDLVGERGMLRYRLGDYESALDDLESYASANASERQHPAALKMLEALRSRLGRGGSLR